MVASMIKACCDTSTIVTLDDKSLSFKAFGNTAYLRHFTRLSYIPVLPLNNNFGHSLFEMYYSCTVVSKEQQTNQSLQTPGWTVPQ